MSKTLNLRIHRDGQLIESKSLTQDVVKIGKLKSSHLCLDDDSVALPRRVTVGDDSRVARPKPACAADSCGEARRQTRTCVHSVRPALRALEGAERTTTVRECLDPTGRAIRGQTRPADRGNR